MIKDFVEGSRVYGPLFIADCKKGVTSTSKSYLTLTFQDASGTMEAKKWDFTPQDEMIFEKGKVVHVSGSVILYSNHLQMKVYEGEAVDQSTVDWSAFIPAAPVSADILEAKLNAYLNSFIDPVIGNLVNALITKYREKYLKWPAASKNHHAFVSGLLFHSLTMTDMAAKVCEVYSSLNRDLMIGGTLIHDIGKTMELSGPNATSYTLEGRLIGHISIGQAEVRATAKELGYHEFVNLNEAEQNAARSQNSEVFHKYEVALLFEHIILSHHGKYEFGSPVLPVTRESLAISMIDDLDAKMLILDNAYAGVNPGEATSKVASMDNRYFYNPFSAVAASHPYGTSLEEEQEDLTK